MLANAVRCGVSKNESSGCGLGEIRRIWTMGAIRTMGLRNRVITMKWKMVLVVLLAAGCFALPNLPAGTAPAPDAAAHRWELEFTNETPTPIMVQLPGTDKAQLFWYMRFTVTNRTGEDQIFSPKVALYTNTGELIQANAGAAGDPAVFAAIKKIHNNPLLVDLTDCTGKLLQGQDNAKDSVVIFPNFDPKASRFDIFVGGLSGETAVIKLPKPIKVMRMDPDGKDVEVETDKLTLTKTIDLKYTLGTEFKKRLSAEVRLASKEWVMR